MQALIKSALGEISRGISTGLVVWSGQSSCPACAPTLTCAPPPRIPDCICGSHIRQSVNPKERDFILLFFVSILSLVIGYLLGRLHSSPTVVGTLQSSRPTSVAGQGALIGKGKWGLRDASQDTGRRPSSASPIEDQR